ncbi:MAG: hypothetical protein NUV97_02185 [archaeon]|nr:hypothetical protein [archaeon]MCR4323758.1 hypothetical protein [Nanoarchaeota archaeon]
MVKEESEPKTIWKVVIVVLIVAIVAYVGWFFLLGYVDCEDKDCFNANLESCIRTKFIGGTDMIYEYIITGDSNERCNVNVKLLQGELNNQNSIKLEGKEMQCSLPLGVIMNPESDIGNCHGLLKEGLQDLIIQKLHTYLVQNVGRINLELLDIPKI